MIHNMNKSIVPQFLSKYFYLSTVTDRILERDPKEEIMKAFKLFDDDESGKISLRNLRRVARELGENVSDEELRSMIDEFDTDGDGESTCRDLTSVIEDTSETFLLEGAKT